MKRQLFKTACILAALAVLFGAFAAHGLKSRISAEQIGIFQTGVRYQFYHTFGIFLLALIMDDQGNKWLIRSAWAFIVGIVLFSGSLYLLSCRDWLEITHWKWLGPITPIGGISFVLGWIFLCLGIPHKIKSS